jgi:hypothetical protein
MGDPFDPFVMARIYRGNVSSHCGIRKRRFKSAFWVLANDGVFQPFGIFETQSIGVFAAKECSIFRIANRILEMDRVGRTGRWFLDSQFIGELKLSWMLWQCYSGSASLMTCDDVLFAKLTFPLMCPCDGSRDSFAAFQLPSGQRIMFLLDPRDCAARPKLGAIVSSFGLSDESFLGCHPVAETRSVFSQADGAWLATLPLEIRALIVGVSAWARSCFPITVP